MTKFEQRYLVFDYETRSEIDLKKSGAWEYSKHPSTDILAIAWKLGTRETLRQAPTKSWSPLLGMGDPSEFVNALADDEIRLVAHNALFEQVITKNCLWKATGSIAGRHGIPISRWICTAALASAQALPRDLERMAMALGLTHQKDSDGRRLMLKWCKPRRVTKKSDAKWHSDEDELKRLVQYCASDVDAETEAFLILPPLNPFERELWELDQKMNLRGFTIDRKLVDACLAMIEKETVALNEETADLTMGMVGSATEVAALTRYLSACGLDLDNLQAKTVADTLKLEGIDSTARRLLEIRQSIGKTSTAKFEAFRARSQTDGRVRDNLIFHSASTGRWGGTGVQPQNFPRPAIKDATKAAEYCRSGDIESVRLLYGNPMAVFSSVLRSVIVASKGKELFCGDYSAVEARVVFWLADHAAGLKMYRDGIDLYKDMASRIYRRPITEINPVQRQLGKQVILGAGFGMGHKKFLLTCESYGITIDEETAERAVKTYRTVHEPVTRLWRSLEAAAVRAVLEPTRKFCVNHTRWLMQGGNLKCELPSGRLLTYQKPEIKFEEKWGEKRPVLYFWGMNSITHQWERTHTYGGSLTENAVQATARDLMADAMVRIEKAGFENLLCVHDEILAETWEIEDRTVEEFTEIMATNPPWAEGLPTKVEAWKGPRYKKG